MVYKIYVVEDTPETFKRYSERIESLEEIEDRGFLFELVSSQPTTEFTRSEFWQDIRENQPDIVFLDFQLCWKVEGSQENAGMSSGTALEVIETLKTLIHRTKFPPVIILNTQIEECIVEINRAFNEDKSRKNFAKDFLMILPPDVLDYKPDILIDTLRSAIEKLSEERKRVDVWKPLKIGSAFRLYYYPPADTVHDKLVTQKQSIRSQAGIETWRRSRHQTKEAMLLNKYGLLVLTYDTGKKLGFMITIDDQDRLQPYLFETSGLDDIQMALDEAFQGIIRRRNSVFYNTLYIKSGFFGDLTFISNENNIIKTRFLNFVKKDTENLGCDIKTHPVLFSLRKLYEG